MSNLNWHPEFLAETIKRRELQDGTRAAYNFACSFVTSGQGLDLLAAFDDAKIVSIAASVRETLKSGNRYKKVTTAQTAALAAALVTKFGTASAMGIAAGLSQSDIDNADI